MLSQKPAAELKDRPPVCDYEGSDYQSTFWDCGERLYEDQVEEIALRRLLPLKGRLLLELGAGAGRNTPRYSGFERVVLLDYSVTQLRQAQERLGLSERYRYVASDIYRLPFVDSLFDAATLIRTLHHLAEPPTALREIHRTLGPEAVFILEYANKRNLKAIGRYALQHQSWSPFSPEAVEFARLNFDFHPRTVRNWLEESGFAIQKQLTVSHFRISWMKRWLPLKLLVKMDSLAQWSGRFWQLTPSVFVRTQVVGKPALQVERGFFRCPECGGLELVDRQVFLECQACQRRWGLLYGIYDFRAPIN